MPGKNIQWFPGHMASARRLINDNIKNVDIVLEILDARIPESSRNPEIKKLTAAKPVLTLFNKASLANPDISAEWRKHFAETGQNCLFCDCITGLGFDNNKIAETVKEILSEKTARWEEKGMSGRKIRALVVGIPNVGKSSFINKMAGVKKAKVENRPGVTLDKQWVSAGPDFELLDMPGILWPKFKDRITGENLALTGAIKDHILDTEELAMILCLRLREIARDSFTARYKLTEDDLIDDLDAYDLFELAGKKRLCLMSGGRVDHHRTAAMLLDEFRSGTIGRISLERPPKRRSDKDGDKDSAK